MHNPKRSPMKMKCYFGKIAFGLFFLFGLSCELKSQSVCSTAVVLSGADTCLTKITSFKDVWFKFIAPNDSVKIKLDNNFDLTNGFTSMKLYSGSCASLTFVDSADLYATDLILFSPSLTSGSTYFIKASRNVSVSDTFELCVKFSVLSLQPCPCQSTPPDCDAICNGGFDTHTGNLNNWDQLALACPWHTAPQINGGFNNSTTSDLFAADANLPGVDVPANGVGNQNSRSNQASATRGYAGIICYSDLGAGIVPYREYLEVPLQYTLQAGQTYDLSFWISVACRSGWSVDDIGAFVTTGMAFQNGGNPITIPAGAPNILSVGNVTSTVWVQISGTITANGGEDYLVIGQFTNNANANPQPRSVCALVYSNHYAYYYIDDVSLKPHLEVNAGTDKTICKASSVTLTGSWTGSGSNPTWSVVGGGILCTNCSTVVVSPTTATQYVFSVTMSGGCVRTDTLTVNIFPPPNVNVIEPANPALCDYGPLNFSIAVSTGWSILWNSNATNSSGSTTTNYSATWTTNTFTQDGWVTVLVTDGNGCTAKDSVVIPHCCCNTIGTIPLTMQAINDNVDSLIAHYPGAVIVSGTNNTITSANLCINGVFTVNKNLTLQNVKVSMGPNARINVAPGFRLTLEGIGSSTLGQTVVQACDELWDGIYVNGPNTSTLLEVKNGTIIEDAKQAIVSVNGGNFQIIGGVGGPVKLNKNVIAVWVKPFSGTHPGKIRNSIISCDAPGQPGATAGITSLGSNCIAPYNAKSFAGVRIDSCTSVTIGDSLQYAYRNLFERLTYGVYASKSNVNVWNNEFRYIVGLIPTIGTGVYATNAGNSVARTLTVGKIGTRKAGNRFQQCNHGVGTNTRMNLFCENNRLDSCYFTGISAMNTTGLTIRINMDTLRNCTGINIRVLYAPFANVKIINNSINLTLPLQATNFGQTGIYVANAATIFTNLLIQNNSIRKMRNGIWVSRVKGAKIVDNGPIRFMPGQPQSVALPVTGIRIESCVNALVRNNTIRDSISPAASQYNINFGIYVENCINDTITKNHVRYMGSGIYLKGGDNPSLLACNWLDTCYYGFNFGWTTATPVPVSLNDQILYGSSQVITPTGNTWNGTVNASGDLVGQIVSVNGLGIYWYYDSYLPTVNMQPLSLNGNSPTPTSNTDQCSNFFASPTVTDAVKRQYMLDGICVNPRSYDTLAALFSENDRIIAYRILRDNPSWLSMGLAVDTAYQNFYTAASSTNLGVFADVEDALAGEYRDSANTMLQSITPGSTIETNRKLVLLVFLHSWAIDSFILTEGQIDTLMPIALQGGLSGGPAVYDARNMLGLEVHDSSNLRTMHQPLTIEPDRISKIFPNPANGQVTVQVEMAEGEFGTFELFDLSGRKVGSWDLQGGQTNHSLILSDLPTGTYIYRITINGVAKQTDRLVIVRE
jgi:parallel beta-helix repeat protein